MNYLAEIKQRFAPVLAKLSADPAPFLEMIRPAQDARHGDYQANFAMPLSKQLGKPGPQIAADICAEVDLAGICDAPEVAGPGFINLRIAEDRLAADINAVQADPRLGVPQTTAPKTVVVDFSSPNIAKPMHVGHIRSTVIGDSISRTLKFAGHKVITDNHIGDWGTQFGMILYGYKNFLDADAYQEAPVQELSRLYRLVNQLIGYHKAKAAEPTLGEKLEQAQQRLEQQRAAAGEDKQAKKALKQLEKSVTSASEDLKECRKKVVAVESDADLQSAATAHPAIGESVLQETAKLHDGDVENRQLWEKFLPDCRDEMQKIYQRLDIQFDHELGESFYHDQLAGVVQEFRDAGLAVESDGAICVFLEGFDAPMIIQKQDGAYLYATTDVATIDYRVEHWRPDEILYVVDFRQGEHFDKLFQAVKALGRDVKCMHIKFGTVTDKEGRPFKTRDGAAGLEWLLDLAVAGAGQIIAANDDAKADGPELDADERRHIANVIGHAAVKYSDLSHNRESDYKFDEVKMVANEGNTATYMQYSYARSAAILRRSEANVDQLRASGEIRLIEPEERALGLEILRLQEAIEDSLVDYRPNLLTSYVYSVATKFSAFFESDNCHVIKSEGSIRSSRQLLVDLTGRVLKQVLQLLGIQVVERM
ncbi:MAG: arginine--tRNA ligase [Planctomycetales bacterium]|nr:arginine--tRNA ligase [Planctomycetales bacterium]